MNEDKALDMLKLLESYVRNLGEERDRYKRERDELMKRAKAIYAKEYADNEEAELNALVKRLDEGKAWP